ncbi:MAG: ACP S-malonyltransferase [Candidatus Poribacteria bacterium]|nr:ACP S-malonyltransferase [Candidatus Poribacteria bacterium]
MSKTAFLFPGQGSQTVGMGRWLDEIPEARAIFDRAAELGFDARAVCNADEDSLNQTDKTQPAIFTVSVATLEALKARGVACDAVAGHSLGEHTALVAAGVVSFEAGLEIVRERGALMAAVGKDRAAGVMAGLGLEDDLAEAICEQATRKDEIVTIANYNCPGQIVISGDLAALSRAGELAMAGGAKRVIPLRVSGAFHSPLMEKPQNEFEEVIAEHAFALPNVAFYPNVTGKAERDLSKIRTYAVSQMTSPVRWEDTIREMDDDGIERYAEVGPGKVLAGLNRRILRNAPVWTTDSATELEEVAHVLTQG